MESQKPHKIRLGDSESLFQKNGGMTYVDAQYFWREFI